MLKLEAVTDATFEERVHQADRPVLVDFMSETCAPCRAMEPTLIAIAEEFAGQASVLSLDIQNNPRVSDALAIRAAPTFIVFHGEKVLFRHVGTTSRTALWNAISDALERW